MVAAFSDHGVLHRQRRIAARKADQAAAEKVAADDRHLGAVVGAEDQRVLLADHEAGAAGTDQGKVSEVAKVDGVDLIGTVA